MSVVQYVSRPSAHSSDRKGERVRYIVVHSTATQPNATSANTLRYLTRNDRCVSAHVYVAQDGVCYQMVPDELAAHHCASASVRFPDGSGGVLANRWTWGIEMFGFAGKPVEPDVVAAGIRCVAEACERLGLGVYAVVGHREIDPSRRSDPEFVDMDVFRGGVATALAPARREDAVRIRAELVELRDATRAQLARMDNMIGLLDLMIG